MERENVLISHKNPHFCIGFISFSFYLTYFRREAKLILVTGLFMPKYFILDVPLHFLLALLDMLEKTTKNSLISNEIFGGVCNLNSFFPFQLPYFFELPPSHLSRFIGNKGRPNGPLL